MEPYTRNFIRASLIWLTVGVAIGFSMAVSPELVTLRRAHVHANTLGFVSMMIFGVAYHVLPRFVGTRLWSNRAARAHLWLANAGLALMVSGWIGFVAFNGTSIGRVLLANGAILSAGGTILFVVNIWRTLGAQPAQLTVMRRAA